MPALFFQSVLLAVMRHFLSAGAGGMVGLGFLNGDVAQQVTGGLMGIVALVWSFIQKAGRPVIAGWLRQYAERLDPSNVAPPPVPPDLSTMTPARFQPAG